MAYQIVPNHRRKFSSGNFPYSIWLRRPGSTNFHLLPRSMQRDLHGLISLTSSVVRQWLQIFVKADDDDAAFFSLFLLYFVSVIVLSPTLVAVMGSLMPHGPFTQPTGGLHRTVLLNVLGNTLYFGSVYNAHLVVTLRLYRLLPSLFVVSFYFVFLKWANPGLFLCLFSSFPHYTIQI